MDSKLNRNHNLQLKNDQYLWRAMKHSDPLALNKLFNKFYEDLFFYGLKLAGNHDHVADTIQDLFANIWEKRKNISDVTHVKAYMFTSLRNRLLKPNPIDTFNRTHTYYNLNYDYNFNISPEDIYIDNESQNETAKIINLLLADLSPKQKEIIYLKFYGNYSNVEISRILSTKKQSVANMLLRTIKILRKKQK